MASALLKNNSVKDGKYHTVHFRHQQGRRLVSKGYEIWFENKPYLQPGRLFARLSRRKARAICNLLNGTTHA